MKGYESGFWFAAYVPAGTPAPVVARLNDILGKANKSEAISELLRAERVRDARRARRMTCASSRPWSRRSGERSSPPPASRKSEGLRQERRRMRQLQSWPFLVLLSGRLFIVASTLHQR